MDSPRTASAELSEEARREFEIEQLRRDKKSLTHELELKAQLKDSELNLMREMLSGFKEERDVTFQRMASLEQQKETLQKEAERALELDQKLKDANAEVAELHEALKELEEELMMKMEEQLASLRSAHDKERQELQDEVARLICETLRLAQLQDENERLNRQLVEQNDVLRMTKSLRMTKNQPNAPVCRILQLQREDEDKEALLDMLQDGKHIDKAGIVKLKRAGRDVSLGKRSPRFDTSTKTPAAAAQTPRFEAFIKTPLAAPPKGMTPRSSTAGASKRASWGGGGGSGREAVAEGGSDRVIGASHLNSDRVIGALHLNFNSSFSSLDNHLSKLSGIRQHFEGIGAQRPASESDSPEKGDGTAENRREEAESAHRATSPNTNLFSKLSPEIRLTERTARFGMSAIPIPATPRFAATKGIRPTPMDVGEGCWRAPISPSKSTAGSSTAGSAPGSARGSLKGGRGLERGTSTRKREPSPSPIRSLRTMAH